ncbi:putative glycoside hydrolase [Pelagicoccus sp. SDUM812005]|uniref:putative glycoside hydrolase n=1 Tax=Pelagicoccus sp. SDUM812005 TaxID=3041257 RepID=UPI0028102F5A|nr:putative glycoside hydrolase [Pelagicoccus sp. SDUM812005]MDQ8183558.1 putative glycoside hydrolase [Pelagicoccus sp. SDUM812005]
MGSLAFLAAAAASGKDERYPEFSWDTVPIAFHFGKNAGLMTPAEAEFVASRSNFICLEKGHAVRTHGSTEAGIEAEAVQLKKLNPKMKVIFYWNTFLDYAMYDAHDEYAQRPEWWLRKADGELDFKSKGLMRYDLSNPDFRDWWTDVAAEAINQGNTDGVFMDAFPQVENKGNIELWGQEKYDAIQQGLKDIIRETREKLGDDKLIVYNGIRSTPNWSMGTVETEYTDAAMIEHFGYFNSRSKELMLQDILEMERAGKAGEIVVMKAWPGFAWIDKEMMQKPLKEKRKLAKDNLLFPLACFLAGAQENCYFIYNWGYRMEMGCLEWYPEFDKPLGKPLGEMSRDGWKLSRDYEHASVWVDLESKEAKIDWR